MATIYQYSNGTYWKIDFQTRRQNIHQSHHEHRKYSLLPTIDGLLEQIINIRQVTPRSGILGRFSYSHKKTPRTGHRRVVILAFKKNPTGTVTEK